jgi:cytochrome c551/c552
MSEVSTKNSGRSKSKKRQLKKKRQIPARQMTRQTRKKFLPATTKEVSFAQVNRLLIKNTCAACHNPEKKQVGPSFKEIARRNYPVSKIVSLIYNPQPQNWPGYATEMPPMPQVPKEEARMIATWIKSLK